MSTATNQQKQEDWWREWFNHIYLDVYAHRDDRAAEDEVRTALSVLSVLPNHNILDLCCGNGRHCRALRNFGYKNVLGVDYSFPLLKHAKPECPTACYVRADMRRLPCRDRSFDAIFSFFTSFGYFQTSVENQSVLHEMARLLRPGGWFLLDYLNPAYVRANFAPESEKQHGQYVIRETRSFSENQKRVEKTIVIENWGGSSHTYKESVRLYEHEEMRDMLKATGLSTMGTLGDFKGHPYKPNAERMILYGVRV
ncbi:methyltransferase domain-containing protein [bacterium]|nr:methyltransferase domain-containing protein [bacterium]